MSPVLNVLSPAFIADPYADYERLQRVDPVHWYEPLGYWLLTRYNDIQAVLRDPRFRSARMPVLFDGIAAEDLPRSQPLRDLLKPRLLFTDGEDHQRLRGLMAHAFTPRQIEAMRPVVRQTMDELLEPLRGRREVDFIREFADPLPSRVITRILGLPAECYDQFKSWTNVIYEFIGISSRNRTERAAAATNAIQEVERFLQQELTNRPARPAPDLLGVLASAVEAGGKLTPAEIIANVVGLLNAGHETTTNLIGNAWLTLLRHPWSRRRLRENPELLPLAIEEVARFESPVQVVARQLAERVTLHNTTMPAGANVLCILGAANRDPLIFERPHDFEIDRVGPRHLGFGLGPHFCIGAAVARLVAEEALQRIQTDWKTCELHAAAQWRPNPVFRGLVELPLVVEWAT